MWLDQSLHNMVSVTCMSIRLQHSYSARGSLDLGREVRREVGSLATGLRQATLVQSRVVALALDGRVVKVKAIFASLVFFFVRPTVVTENLVVDTVVGR